MPRILMTTDAVGGVWTYALELARALAPHDLAVTLATMGPPPSADQVDAARAIPELRLETSAFRLEWMSDAWADVDAAGEWLLDLEADIRPVVGTEVRHDVRHGVAFVCGPRPVPAMRLDLTEIGGEGELP